MENIVCDTSALLYWRTPPLARLLAAAPEDDPLLRHLVSPRRLRRLRADLADCSPLTPGIRCAAHLGGAGRELMDARGLLATGFRGPVDVLAPSREDRRPSEVARPRLWSEPVPSDQLFPAGQGTLVVVPALALRQVAVRATPVRTALLLGELLGSFSAYQPPAPMGELLQELADASALVRYQGWQAGVDNDGRLTGLWSHPPLLTPSAVSGQLEKATTRRGVSKVRAGLELARPNAASPFEVQAGMLLGTSVRRGGEGLGRFSHNRRVALGPRAARVARRSACFCDLFWEAEDTPSGRAVDVECQSAAHHFGTRSTARDADRATALQMMGVEVVQLTYAQLADALRFSAFSQFLAGKLGVASREKTERELKAQAELRSEVLADWESLPFV